MRSHPNTSRSHPLPPEPPARARRAERSRSGRRRARPVPEPIPHEPEFEGSPQALYRAEKARRASNVDATIMAEAKRLYDEAVAESGKKRAGMRSPVIAPGARRGAAAGKAAPDIASTDSADLPDEAEPDE